MGEMSIEANCSESETTTEFSTIIEGEVTLTYFSKIYQITGTLLQGPLFLLGFVGNLLLVFVVARSRSLWTPTSCYLVSLAIADCILLVAAIPQEIVGYYLIVNQWIWGDVGCMLLAFWQNLGITTGSLSVVAATIECYLSICKPLATQTICGVCRALKIVLILWIFSIVYSFPWIFLTATYPVYHQDQPIYSTCDHKICHEQYLTYFYSDLLLFYIIPAFLSIFLYSKIAYTLIHHSIKCCANTVHFQNRIQIVKMLSLISALNALLWLPYRSVLVYNTLAEQNALNPILCCTMSTKFRRAFGNALNPIGSKPHKLVV
ncbi:Thyrotropin-releasing hormone receptor [Orchesella cincta]|uniref:Thyrotropin-releasing hormone receptor n=1 Tax=Orchesella cincta TaxID=48709 RepID=A0A1D2M7R3_ORCCI|nr:Thyrotropin-releasing hormone receptor [Orchesella cincta]